MGEVTNEITEALAALDNAVEKTRQELNTLMQLFDSAAEALMADSRLLKTAMQSLLHAQNQTMQNLMTIFKKANDTLIGLSANVK
jgi:hypothetical protein